jgi:hypothetical protein
MNEPYWVRDHQEHQEREAAQRAVQNPPPAKSTAIRPLLHWDRTITWWPKHDWERYDKVTTGNDLSPADQGYKLHGIRDMAFLGENADGFPTTSVEVIYSAYICDECPQECGYIIVHKCDSSDEESVCEDGFKTIDEAREAATQALAALLIRDAG